MQSLLQQITRVTAASRGGKVRGGLRVNQSRFVFGGPRERERERGGNPDKFISETETIRNITHQIVQFIIQSG